MHQGSVILDKDSEEKNAISSDECYIRGFNEISIVGNWRICTSLFRCPLRSASSRQPVITRHRPAQRNSAAKIGRSYRNAKYQSVQTYPLHQDQRNRSQRGGGDFASADTVSDPIEDVEMRHRSSAELPMKVWRRKYQSADLIVYSAADSLENPEITKRRKTAYRR